MRRFAIKEENSRYPLWAILIYDEKADRYGVEIPENIDPDHLPAILGILARKGIYSVQDKWARRFVKERVVPPNRQNIGMIMRDVGMTYYSEFPLLVYTQGRCCMDEFYLEELLE